MKIKQIVRVALFTALICIFTISVPPIIIPVINVPITLQTMIVMLAASVLPKKEAFLSMVLYIILGGLGLPVFSGMKSGFQVLVGLTGGFLLSFPIAAYMISLLKGQGSFYRLLMLNIIFGIGLVYVFGVIQMSLYTKQPFISMLIPLLIIIPFDIIKAILATTISIKLKRIII